MSHELRPVIAAIRFLAPLAFAATVGASATSCLVPNTQHCSYNGGDAWCQQQGLGQACIAAIDESAEGKTQRGCVESITSDLDVHAHVKWGLPTAVFNDEVGRAAGAETFATFEGIRATLVGTGELDAACEVPLEMLRAQVEEASQIRVAIDPGGRVAKKHAFVTADERDRIHAMNGAIDLVFDPCRSDGGTGTETGETEGDTTTGETDTDVMPTDDGDTTTTGPIPCGGNGDCMDPAAPLCGRQGECVGCSDVAGSDAACTELDPMAPLCVADACVACTEGNTEVCEAQGLVCDTETNGCVPCTQHDECPSGACDLLDDAPTCLPVDNVLEVGAGQTFETIGEALTAVETMGLDPAVLVLHEGADFNEAAEVSSGTVAFIGAVGERPLWAQIGIPMTPTLSATGAGTRVYVSQLRMTGNLGDVALSCDGAGLHVQRSEIVANSGGAVSAMAACDLRLENSFLGGSVNNVIAVNVNGSTARINYATIGAGFGNAVALNCGGGFDVVVRNSLLVSEADIDEVFCDGATITNSATEQGIGGTDLEPMNTNWFGTMPTSYADGDFHLSPLAPPDLANAGEWQSGDPPSDIDGTPRPAVNGSPDYVGADVP